MKSLRTRLVTWYVSVGAIIVLCIGILGAVAAVEAISYQTRQTLAQAARETPALVEQYRTKHHDLQGVNEFLQGRFAARGIMAQVIPDARFIAFDTKTMRLGVAAAGPPPPGLPSQKPVALGRQKPVTFTQTGPSISFSGGGSQSVMVTQGAVPPPPGAGMHFVAFEKRAERPRAPFFVAMLAMAIKPVTASFKGGNVILFIDPHTFKGVFSVLGLLVLALTVIVIPAAWRIAVAVAENTLEPLLHTTKALNRFGSGDFTPEAVKTEDRSELGELAHAYNRAVEQITRAFDERSKTEAEMRQFVADAGHQLRTPLTVIMGYLSGMAQRAESTHQAATYNTMLAQARRMKYLIDDLITLARLERPSTPETHYVDLNALCARLPSNFSQTDQERIRVRGALTPAVVAANENDISGALCALVDNSLKYAAGSDVDVTIAQDSTNWLVSVADRGPGMTSEDLRGAFDRFYRGGASEGVEGTGLGLPIVRKTIERLGGTILLSNRIGGGLLVTMRLPKPASIVAAAR